MPIMNFIITRYQSSSADHLYDSVEFRHDMEGREMGSAQKVSTMRKEFFTECHSLQNKLSLVVRKGNKIKAQNSFKLQDSGMVEIGFNLGGDIKGEAREHGNNPRILSVEQGQVHIDFYSGRTRVLKFLAGNPVCWIGVLLPVDMLSTFFETPLFSPERMNDPYASDSFVHKSLGPITTGMKVALHQILVCPFTGKTKLLFFESKVLELISHVRFSADRSTSPEDAYAVSLTSSDKERLWQARYLLDKSLENPPSITELARFIGVNEFKLKNGFRQVHGITPYKYLSEKRLERARYLLRERQMNVTEAAFAVGYSSLSHFAKIFRARFGVNPHEFLVQEDGCLEAGVAS